MPLAPARRAPRRGWAVPVVVAILVAFATVNLVNALYKGGDFDVFLESGRRALDGEPLYAPVNLAAEPGIVGPPFQALFFAPFAALAAVSTTTARVAWYTLNLLALGIGVWCWQRAIAASAFESTLLRPAVLLSLVAIALPAQTNFEFQNMNALLLGVLGAAAWCLARNDDGRAAILIGFATALKAFPALFVVYAILRREWRVGAAALAWAGLFSALPLLRYGWDAPGSSFGDWIHLRAGGRWFPEISSNQSVFAVATRLDVPWLGVALAAVLLGAVAVLALRSAGAPRRAIGPELALTLAVGVLVSPLAWDHYWVLLFPAFLVAAEARTGGRGDRWIAAAFWAAAVLTSGLSRVTVGRGGLTFVRWWGNSTLAGLILVAAVGAYLWWSIILRGRLPPARRAPNRSDGPSR